MQKAIYNTVRSYIVAACLACLLLLITMYNIAFSQEPPTSLQEELAGIDSGLDVEPEADDAVQGNGGPAPSQSAAGAGPKAPAKARKPHRANLTVHGKQ